MSAVAEQLCFACDRGIALEDFLEWPDTRHSRFAICGWCGAPNEQVDPAFVVLDQATPTALPAPAVDVFSLVDGRWRACCDCGLTEAVATQADGWSWVVDHSCATRLD